MYMDDIKGFAKKWKRPRAPDTNNKNILSGYRNRIWYCKMCHVDNKGWKKRNNGRDREGKLLELGNIGSGHHKKKAEMKEKYKERVFQ